MRAKNFRIFGFLLVMTFISLFLAGCEHIWHPYFAVSVEDHYVEEGEEKYEVEAKIENTGIVDGRQDIELTIEIEGLPDYEDTKENVELDPGELKTVTFMVEAPEEFPDPGVYEDAITVESEDDGDIANLIVEAPYFKVDIEAVQEEVTWGDELTIMVEVENTGGQADTQIIEFYAYHEDDEDELLLPIETREITLEPGESKMEEEEVLVPHNIPTGDYILKLTSADDEDTDIVTLVSYKDEPYFEVDIDEKQTDTEVEQGEDCIIVADITNTGNEKATQDIKLVIEQKYTINGNDIWYEDTIEDLELEEGEREKIKFHIPGEETEEAPAQPYIAEVSSEDETDEITIEVLKPAYFKVTVEDHYIAKGEEEYEAEADIENTGEVKGVQDIELTIEIEGLPDYEDTKENVELDPGELKTVIFMVEAPEEFPDPGVYEDAVTVESEDDEDSGDLIVEEKPYFVVDTVGCNSPLPEGEILEIDVQVGNTGEVAGTQTIELVKNGEILDEKELYLEVTEVELIVLEWETEENDAGEYKLEVRSEDTEAFWEVEILENWITIYPEVDTAIGTNDPLLEETYYMEFWEGDPDTKANIYLQFDLEEIPEGVDIEFAQLQLFALDSEIVDGHLGVFRVLEQWDEDTEWEERPAISEDPVDRLFFAGAFIEEEWLKWEVTETVEYWLADGENYGFRLGHVYDDDFFGVIFYHSGAEDEDFHPRLGIGY